MGLGNGYDAKTMLSRIVEREAQKLIDVGNEASKLHLYLLNLDKVAQASVLSTACQNLGINWDDYEREVFRAVGK